MSCDIWGQVTGVQKSSTETAHAPTFTNALIASCMHNKFNDFTHLVLKVISITQRVLYSHHAVRLKKPKVRAFDDAEAPLQCRGERRHANLAHQSKRLCDIRKLIST